VKESTKISYCIVCKNKSHSPKTGVVCGLTNEKPNFEISCPDYKFTPSELNQLIDNKRKYLKIVQDETNNLKRRILMSNETYQETKYTPSFKFNKMILPDKIDILTNYVTKILSSIGLFLLMLVLLLFDPYDYKLNNPYFYSILILVSIVGSIVLFIQSRNRKPKMIIDREGIWTKKTGFIHWQRIVLTTIKTKHDNPPVDHLVLFLSDDVIEKEIFIGKLHISQSDLENYIELFKKDYWKRTKAQHCV
jgi:hypothetical protein